MFCLALQACGGGGNSSVTTIICQTANCQATGVEANLPYAFVQQANNLAVTVDAGPGSTFSLGQANILYATVTICVPGDRTNCQTIDHLQVDTGSVGLRVLASKVKQLALPPVALTIDASTGNVKARAWECYPFVIGGLWGPTVVADVSIGPQTGPQWATALPVQLIQDNNPSAAVQVPIDCSNAVSGTVLDSVSALGSNGVLGIGSVTLDCGHLCVGGKYAGTYVQYYSCPVDATSSLQCTAAAVGANQQVFNPVAALPIDNNGVVLVLPQVTGLGATKAHGELILGINTRSNNQLSATAPRIRLGVDPNVDSYLNITTQYNGQTIYNSYLDTGTNAVFFTDPAISFCKGSSWYCPVGSLQPTAVLSDGDKLLPQNPVTVQFGVGNADALFSTANTAFADLAGAAPASLTPGSTSFSWGLPFFYGRRVSLSIWDPASADILFAGGPWYSF
jgi:hypothetical protein